MLNLIPVVPDTIKREVHVKYLLTLISFWSISSFAANICTDSWIYKNYGSCRHYTHGIDNQYRPVLVDSTTVESPELDGKNTKNKQLVCQNAVNRHNVSNEGSGKQAVLLTPLPVAEQSKKDKAGHVTYRYKCEVEVWKYVYNRMASPVCGSQGPWVQSFNLTNEALPETASCLTCDGPMPVRELRSCVIRSVEALNQGDITVRPHQLSRLQERIEVVLLANRRMSPAQSLDEVDARLLIDFLNSKARR